MLINPEDPLALVCKGIILRHQNKLADSASVLRKAIKISPESPLAICELSSTLLAEDKGKEAIELAEQALQIAPSNLEAKAVLAFALIHEKNFDGGVYILKECVVRNPKDLNLRMILANAQIAKGNGEFPDLTLEKARSLFPDRAEPLVGLARLAMDEHNYKHADELLEQALICANADQSILSLRAQNFAAMGKAEECLQTLSTLSDAELSAADLTFKARSEFALRDYASAVSDYMKVVNRDNIKEPADILNLAKSLLETGEPTRAQEFLNKIEADDKLLRQCKQAQIDKLQSDLRHALVKKAN